MGKYTHFIKLNHEMSDRNDHSASIQSSMHHPQTSDFSDAHMASTCLGKDTVSTNYKPNVIAQI